MSYFVVFDEIVCMLHFLQLLPVAVLKGKKIYVIRNLSVYLSLQGQ